MNVLLLKVKQLIKKVMEKELIEFLRAKLTLSQYEESMRQIFGSSIRRTKFLNNPKIATHAELLDIAELCKVTPFWLFSEYNVGFDNLTLREIGQLSFIFLQVSENKKLAAEYIEKRKAAMAA